MLAGHQAGEPAATGGCPRVPRRPGVAAKDIGGKVSDDTHPIAPPHGTPPEAAFAGYAGEELETIALARNYYEWLSEQFRPFLCGTVLDLGAGIGTFSKRLLVASVTRLLCLEPAENLVPLLRRAMAAYGDRIAILPTPAEELADHLEPASLDTVVSVNVLEHIPQDAAVLCALRDLLKPGGHLCLFVPAMPGLWGSLDTAYGHVRRYTRRELSEKLQGAGFRIVSARYWNLLGAAGWLWMGRVRKRTALSPGMVRTFDRIGVPYLRRVEPWLRLPFGQSLLAVAERPP